MAKVAGSTMDRIVSLCRRRGFIFQSSEIYGGINGFWDYGPLGVELKRNLREAWWQDMVRAREDMVGIETTIIMHPQVWKASGHFDLFCDMMQTCRQCKKLFRADHVADAVFAMEWYKELQDIWRSRDLVDLGKLREWARKSGKKKAPGLGLVRKTDAVLAALEELLSSQTQLDPRPDAWFHLLFNPDCQQSASDTCPNCGGDLTEPREFNLMFETYRGAVRDEESKTFLRPETAQGIFVNFRNVVDSTRIKLPFGIAQIGKSFRNEITPRNFSSSVIPPSRTSGTSTGGTFGCSGTWIWAWRAAASGFASTARMSAATTVAAPPM